MSTDNKTTPYVTLVAATCGCILSGWVAAHEPLCARRQDLYCVANPSVTRLLPLMEHPDPFQSEHQPVRIFQTYTAVTTSSW